MRLLARMLNFEGRDHSRNDGGEENQRDREADGRALPQRAVEDVAQVEEPGERCGAARARGGVALELRSLTTDCPPGTDVCTRRKRTCGQGGSPGFDPLANIELWPAF